MTAPGNNLEQPERLSYRQYARHVRLLRELAPPAAPSELRDPAFLEAIYERAVTSPAGEDPGRDLGGFLAAALPPCRAPEETAAGDCLAQEAADRPELVAHFQGSGDDQAPWRTPAWRTPAWRTPGWLWQRIQADLRRQQDDRRRHAWVFRLKVAAAAAVFLVVGTSVSLSLAGPTMSAGDGPADDVLIQVQRLDEPIGEAFHPTDRLRLIAGGR